MKVDIKNLSTLTPLLERILDKKSILDSHRPLPKSAVDRVRHDLSLEWTYNSNGIEGNSLTLAETRVVLEDGITIGGKSLREHFEVINHDKAVNYLESIIARDYILRSIDLLELHGLVMKGIDDDFGGRLRNGRVRIVGANFTPPGPEKVGDLLDELISSINLNEEELSIPLLAAIFHHKFVWIHPFFDGNGRTGRLAMNMLLMKYGYPPAVILKADRKKYYNALNAANNGDYARLALLIFQAIERSLSMYMNVIPKAYGEYQPLADIAKEAEVPYGMEYISLLARTGRIDAHKEGRNWVTTKEAVLAYASNH